MTQFVQPAVSRVLISFLTILSAFSLSGQSQDTIWNFEEKCVLEYSDFYRPLSPQGVAGSENAATELIAFSHLAAIRKKATAEADVVARVPMGESVQVSRFLDVLSTVEGVEAPWCEVKFKGKKGYMWTGALTSGTIRLSDSSYVCWGLARIVVSEDDYQCIASVRRFKNGQQLQRLEVDMPNMTGDNTGQLRLWCAPALKGVLNVIEFSTYAEDVGMYNAYNYFTWDGKNLKYINFGYSKNDENDPDDSRKVTFPYPPFVSMDLQRQLRGYPASNQVMVKESYGEWNEDCVWDEHLKVKFLAWPDLLPVGCE